MEIVAARLVGRDACAFANEALSSVPCSKRSSKGNSI